MSPLPLQGCPPPGFVRLLLGRGLYGPLRDRPRRSLTQGVPRGRLFVPHTVSRERHKQLLSAPRTEQMVLMK